MGIYSSVDARPTFYSQFPEDVLSFFTGPLFHDVVSPLVSQ